MDRWQPLQSAVCLGMLVYQYPNCSTCRKALKFLEASGVDFRAKDIVETPPSKSALKKAHKLSGLPLRKLFNTSGQSYRSGGFKEKLETMSEDEALTALAADGKLIKRPLLLGEGFALVGFNETSWRDALDV
jgi:arsenate reductase